MMFLEKDKLRAYVLIMRASSILAAIALSLSPAIASAWCPIPKGADYSSIPAGSHVEVARNSLTIFEGAKQINCTPQGHDSNGNSSDFACPAYAVGIPCDPANEICIIGVEFAPSDVNDPVAATVPLNEFDLSRPDITKYDLWLRPANDMRVQAFHLCGPDDATM